MAFSILEINYADHKPSAESGLLALCPGLALGPDICLIHFAAASLRLAWSQADVSWLQMPCVGAAFPGDTAGVCVWHCRRLSLSSSSQTPFCKARLCTHCDPHPCGCHLCDGSRGTGQVSAAARQVFDPVQSSGGHWVCSALRGPGWALVPQKGASKSCWSSALPGGCWAPQDPVLPWLRNLCDHL